MTVFYLIRHGTKEALRGDPILSELGVKQAKITGKYLHNFSLSALFTSPLKRAEETADIIGKELGLTVTTDNRLTERMNWGDKEKESFEAFLQEWEKATVQRKYQPKYGDSAYTTGKRLKAFLREKAEMFPEKNIGVVTHGGTIGDFLQNYFANLPITYSQTNVPYVHILECSITTVIFKNNEFTLKEVGSTTHLAQPLL